ncbi:MAG TPA: hypothetical protein VEN29_07445, partial [Casimicrobiaceae bacterium]|nr:hypothetical protein [Casimicrobiaceae bacterium]
GSITELSVKWRMAASECRELSERLRLAYPPVIDYFLGGNPDLVEVGKFMIAWVIMDCEHDNIANKHNQNDLDLSHKHNWYRFILNKMLSGAYADPRRVLGNDVTFVTFNYDVSLERYLYMGLNSYAPMDRAPGRGVRASVLSRSPASLAGLVKRSRRTA